MRGARMTRKPRRHALSVPVRSGSEVGFPQSLGEVHDMLYDKSLERDNCGFGLIAHIEGEPSHKVVRTAIHALARMQHRGAILADGKTGDGCGLLLQKPDRFFRIVAQERGWRLAKNYAVGMLFLNKDPELAAAARRIVEEELQRETLSIVGWRDVPTNEGVLGEGDVLGDLIIAGVEAVGRCVLAGIDRALLQRGEHLAPAHRLRAGAERGVKCGEEIAAGDSDLQALQVLRRLDRMLSAGHRLKAVVDRAEIGQSFFRKNGIQKLAALSEESVLGRLIILKKPRQGADHHAVVKVCDNAGGMNVEIHGAVAEQLKTLGHIAAGKLVVREDVHCDNSAGGLLHEFFELVGDSRVYLCVCAVHGHGEFDAVVAIRVLELAALRTAGTQRKHQGQREDKGQRLSHFQSFLSALFSLLRVSFGFICLCDSRVLHEISEVNRKMKRNFVFKWYK